jgi:preprotein translocase subunit SecD
LRRWAVLLVVLALAGCTSERVAGTPSRSTASASSTSDTGGPVDLTVPLEFARVTPPGTTGPSASVLPDPDGTQMTLEPPFLTVTRLERAKVKFQEYAASWGLEISMTDEDAKVFGAWTTAHVGEQVAVVAAGKVIFAPQIQGAITKGAIEITGKYTQQQADDLLAKLTGRR